jgi:hypothetical protein
VVFLWFSYGFLVVFLWFSYGFLVVFLGLKQKENKKKTQENPRKPEEKKTTAPPNTSSHGLDARVRRVHVHAVRSLVRPGNLQFAIRTSKASRPRRT